MMHSRYLRHIETTLETRWKLSNEIRRLLTLPYIRLRFTMHGVAWGRDWRIYGLPLIQRHQGSRIELGSNLSLRSTRASNPLSPNHPVVLATRTREALIKVGSGCGFTGATLVAAERIEIGDRVLLGANVTVVDTDFHPLDPEERIRDPLNGNHKPVVIEDDVFVGMNSIILRGVTIGRQSVVGAGSVVVKSIPSGVVAAGNPARVVRPLLIPR